MKRSTSRNPLLAELPITFAFARRMLPKLIGTTVSANTMVRWWQFGLLSPTGRRFKLETVRQGGRHTTSREAVRRFGRLSGAVA